ncbi:MAG: lipoprotein [Rhodospirillales bacterium]|nr:lipoprotein [Rhodospirillales bacterium]
MGQTDMIRKIVIVMLILALASSLAACGRKSSPEHPKGSDHPRTYPTQ